METVVLQVLEFRIHTPIPTDYLDRFLCCVPNTDILERNAKRVRHLCLYLLDLCLHDIQMVQWGASTVTAATVCLATKIIAEYCGAELEHADMEVRGLNTAQI